VEAIEDRDGERTLWREDTLVGSFNRIILKLKSQFGELLRLLFFVAKAG